MIARQLRFAALALVSWAWLATQAMAGFVTYNFDAPNFILGETTPLLDRAPNIGTPAFPEFRTSFTSTPTANGLLIASFMPNVLFSGQILYDPAFPVDLLTLTFNLPVDQVQLNFAVITPATLTIATPVGSSFTASTNVGGPFLGGTASFASATPFTSLQLSASGPTGSALIAIDNLQLNVVVPEPGSIALMVCGLGTVAVVTGLRRRRAAA